MIVINLNRRERKRPTADLCAAYGCGILFSLHQISLLPPESALLASLCSFHSSLLNTYVCSPKNRWIYSYPRKEKNAPFGLKLEAKTILCPYCRCCLAESRHLKLAGLRWRFWLTCWPRRSERICRNKTLVSLRRADKRDTRRWRAGKTETILSNIDLS